MLSTWYPARQVEVAQMTSEAEAQDAQRNQLSGQQAPERRARFLPGIRMLVLGLAVLIAGAALLWLARRFSGDAATALVWLGALVLVAGAPLLPGLTAVVPGRAHVVQLFGKYRGTIRESGLQWVNPFTNRIALSTRIRNQESAQLKVNDADGNPIEIAAVVVWQVRDTARATYSVDDYTHFVTIQTETAVRHIASSYPYDNRGSGAMSLRDNADEITQKLSAELTDRVRPVRTSSSHASPGCPTPPRSPRPCCASRRPARSSARGSASSKAPSAWCSLRRSGWRAKG